MNSRVARKVLNVEPQRSTKSTRPFTAAFLLNLFFVALESGSMHIAVIGTGYVGLVTGACFAEFGVDVTCVDVDETKIQRLLEGVMPIYEPGLEQLVLKNTQAGRLRFTTDVRQAIEEALVIFLAVGTPPKPDGSPDLSFVESAALSIADHMNGYKVVVTKSTVPIGTGEHIRKLITGRKKTRATFGVVSNPEFLEKGLR